MLSVGADLWRTFSDKYGEISIECIKCFVFISTNHELLEQTLIDFCQVSNKIKKSRKKITWEQVRVCKWRCTEYGCVHQYKLGIAIRPTERHGSSVVCAKLG